MGITKSGDKLEEIVESTVPWLSRFEEDGKKIQAKIGDLRSSHSSMQNQPYIEVKDNAWNQLRPWKYQITIGRNKKENKFFVMPPEDLIKIVIHKKGQHTLNAMEVSNLGKPSSTNWAAPYVVDKEDLENRILEVHKNSHSSNKNKIKDFANSSRKKVEKLVEENRKQYEKIITL